MAEPSSVRMPTPKLTNAPALEQWLKKNARKLPSSDNTWSHVSMDGLIGGRIRIDDSSGFMLQVSCSEIARDRMYLVERATPNFPMFFDLDFRSPFHLDMDRIAEYVKCCQTALKRFYPDADQSICEACVARSEMVEQDGMIKDGVHVILPKMIVNHSQARWLRQCALEYLVRSFPRTDGANQWDDIVDASVYREASGTLRMLYARKCKQCECKGRGVCSLCGGTRKVDLGRPYEPSFKVMGDGQVKQASYRTPFEALREFTIRDTMATSPNPLFKVFCGAPAPPDIDDRHFNRLNSSGTFYRVDQEGMDKICSKKKRRRGEDRTTITSNDQRWSMLESLIRQHKVNEGRQPYLEITIQTIYVNTIDKQPSNYLIVVRGIGQHYCGNKGAEHGGNRVYFVLTRKGLLQRCHSQKAPRGEPCQLYNKDDGNGPTRFLHTLTDEAQSIFFFTSSTITKSPLDMHMGASSMTPSICRPTTNPANQKLLALLRSNAQAYTRLLTPVQTKIESIRGRNGVHLELPKTPGVVRRKNIGGGILWIEIRTQ